MTIWHKIFIGLIFLTIPVVLFFACRTLKTHQVWRSKAQQLQKQIASFEVDSAVLEYGEEPDKVAEGETPKKGIHDLVLELDSIMFMRGRVWFDTIATINTSTGIVTVEVVAPSPHNIVQGTILYCFDSTPIDEGGLYMGKFTVAEVDNEKIKLVPSMDCDPEGKPSLYLQNRLKKSLGNWNLYEKMPLDERRMFQQMTEVQLRELFPETSVDQYVNDGKDDPTRPGQKYERKLRDYELLFDFYSKKMIKISDQLRASTFDKMYVENTLADAKLQEQFQQGIIDQLKTERALVTKERDSIVNHLQKINAQYSIKADKVAKYRTQNRATAIQINRIQLEAAKKINERVQSMISVL